MGQITLMFYFFVPAVSADPILPHDNFAFLAMVDVHVVNGNP